MSNPSRQYALPVILAVPAAQNTNENRYAPREQEMGAVLSDNMYDDAKAPPQPQYYVVAPPYVPQPLPPASSLYGEQFIQATLATNYQVHVEKWSGSAWRAYKKNCGTFCLASALFLLITFVFFVLFAAVLNGIVPPQDENTNSTTVTFDYGASTTINSNFLTNSISTIALIHTRHSQRQQQQQQEDLYQQEQEQDQEVEQAAGAIAFIVIASLCYYLFIYMPFHEGFVLASISALRGQDLCVSSFFAGYNHLCFVITKAAIIIVAQWLPLGFVLSCYMSLALMFYIPLHNDHNELTSTQCLRLSMKMVNKQLCCGWMFFVLAVVGMNLVGFMLMGFGLFLTIPLTLAIVAAAYIDIFTLTPQSNV